MKKFKLALTGALAVSALPTLAADFKLTDGIDASINGTLSLGTTQRTDAPNPSNYSLIPSTVVGAPAGQFIGQTGGSDLNFGKGQAVSSVVKALIDLDVHGKNLGVFVRVSAWHDFVLGQRNAPYGNYPNGYIPNTALSDNGFSAEAKFSNTIVRDAYVYGKLNLNEGRGVELRVGRQVINWGTSQFYTGGIGASTNPLDLAAQTRPGALPQEGKLPVGMVSVNFNGGKVWGVEGFLPYEFRATNLPGCGTFFDTANIVQPGCNLAGAVAAPVAGTPLATLASLTERSILASGYYLHRNPDTAPSSSGQFGLSFRYLAAAWGTEFRAYAMNTAHTLPNIYRVSVESVNGATLPAGLAGGLGRLTNANGLKYGVVFPANVRLFGATFDTKLNPTTRIFGELAYRPNQPLGINGTDILTAFLLRAPNSLLQLQRNVLAVPAGGTWDGFDRFAVTTVNLGLNKVFPQTLGAERVVLALEAGGSFVGALPDPSVIRYGRALAFGAAPYIGSTGSLTACAETAPGLNGVPGKTCTTEGFTTGAAWGLRGRISATYNNVLFGAALTPSLTVAKDITGFSYDGTFSKGRLTLRPALRADWGKRYFAELAYTGFSGGNYNLLADRSNLTLAVGINF